MTLSSKLFTRLLLGIVVALLVVYWNSVGVIAQTTVVYWDKWGSGTDRDAIETMVDKFNHSQNEIYVEYNYIDNFLDQFVVATAGGTAPDLLGLWNHRTAPLSVSGLIQPLDEMIQRVDVPINEIIPGFLELGIYEGKLYTLPALPSVIALIWNHDVFESAGLDANTPPRTLDDLLEVDRVTTRVHGDGEIERVGFSPHFPNWWPYLWGWLDGGSLWDPESGRITATNDRVVAGFEFIRDIVQRQNRQAMATFQSGWGEYMQPFYDGKLATGLMGSWVPNHLATDAPDVRYGVSHVPHGPNGEPFVMLEYDGWAIPTGADEPEAALKFLAWMYQPENAKEFALLRGQFSVVQSVNTPDFFRELGSVGMQQYAMLSIEHAARFVPNMPIWDEYGDGFSHVATQTMELEGDPRTLLQQLQETMQPRLNSALGR